MRINAYSSTTNSLLLANFATILFLLTYVFYDPYTESLNVPDVSPSLNTQIPQFLTLQVGLPTEFKCTEEEKRSQVRGFNKKKTEWLKHFKLGCTEPVRLDSFLSYIWPLSQRSITVVNVGANKGYNLVRWWEAWSPKTGVNSRSWGKHLKKIYPEYFINSTLCGTCWYCEEKLFDTYHRETVVNLNGGNSMRIIGVEPSQANFELLQKLKDWTNHSVIETYNFAASDQSGEAKFPITRLGWTRASLSDASSSSRSEFTTIRVVTVDEMMAELQISSIEYLLIDTEGYDPLVIRGGQNALQDGKISVIEFEYTGIGMWKKTSLEETVNYLSDFSYDCYLKIPEGHLIRLTGCFDKDAFEFYVVSNVLCVHRSQALINEYLLSHCFWL